MTQGCLTPEKVDELLDKLSGDSQFREQFLGNPALVLSLMGAKVDPAHIPAIRRLPSPDVLKANREAIKSKLVGTAGLPLFLLD